MFCPIVQKTLCNCCCILPCSLGKIGTAGRNGTAKIQAVNRLKLEIFIRKYYSLIAWIGRTAMKEYPSRAEQKQDR